ncbi:MAG: DUF2147 domain-containing protein [Sphingomicrobium sp.]
MFAALLLAATQAAAASSIEGQWRSPGGNSIIAVAPCGQSLCGTVAWASARARKDAAKATSQLVGTQLLTDVRQGKGERWNGRLFIPDKNMRVTAKLELTAGGQLRVSGCLAGKSMCKAQLWTRADGPLPASD